MSADDEKPPKPAAPTSDHVAHRDKSDLTAAEGDADPPADEKGGPKGKEPTRYGDWENKGIAWDF